MIRSVMVISEKGDCIYSESFGESPTGDGDASMIGGLVSAVISFGRVMAKSEVNEIKMGTLTLILLQKKSLIFALAIDDDESFPDHEKELAPISALFIQHYGDAIRTLTDYSETSIFSDFTQVLKRNGHIPW